MSLREIQWVEKYRPTKIDDCVVPDNVKDIFKGYIEKGDLTNNLLLSGGPGTGKTTIAKALCDELGCDWLYINGSEDSGIDTLRTTIRSYASTMSMSGGRKIIIVDEADFMNANSLQPALRGAIEEFAKNAGFIFTCNFKGRIIEPIQSRTSTIEFKLTGKDRAIMAMQFLERVKYILETEGVAYNETVLVTIIKKYFPDFRKTINELQKFSQQGPIDEGVLAQVSDVNIKELCKFLKEKDFVNVKKWVVMNNDNDPTRIYRRIYEGLGDIMTPQSVPQAVIILAKYTFQHGFSADAELCLLACLTELMIDCFD